MMLEVWSSRRTNSFKEECGGSRRIAKSPPPSQNLLMRTGGGIFRLFLQSLSYFFWIMSGRVMVEGRRRRED